MICYVPALDYLRLTSYEAVTAKVFSDVMESVSLGDDWKESSWQQYRGVQWDNYFWGVGVQRGRTHYLMDCPGQLAANVAHEFLRHNLLGDKCTRLDVQITLPEPDGYDPREFADHLRTVEWPWRQRMVPLVESGDGTDLNTVYIGSINSEKRARVYQKRDDKGRRWLRWELELKQSMATKAWDAYKLNTTALFDAMRGELSNMPDHPIWRMYDQTLTHVERSPLKYEKKISTNHSTMDWLARQVTSSIKRMLNYHETRSAMIQLVEYWHKLAQEARDRE